MALRVVVLVSGSGTLLQALIDAHDAGELPVQIVAVGSDRAGIEGLARADRAGVATFVEPLAKGADRSEWDRRITTDVAGFQPDLVVCAGFMKLLGPAFLARFGGRVINSHPALLPSFPGVHGPRDALAYGVRITGATVFMVDAGVDTGRILAQRAVEVAPDDTVETLHERIKVQERQMLVEVVADLATTLTSTELSTPD
ncbi:phosphoribosylglycinamide formyltransferase [Acidipropionibacterium jensenii]|uniref:phosphoribosylglycinamide formyltransferase n=1 Tax=Acidipropionibacterium jensenii TaxID=1749 RepID=UPI000BEF1345|nr:phosphoribosylglycinamide formyltransferase [Acidipropionibacterium jensenii]AZZ43391.1 phosphoribosylglycinamide formyltransferase [Acidipropionibacterium jensenii]